MASACGLEVQTYFFPRRFFVFPILPGPFSFLFVCLFCYFFPYSFSCQQNSWVCRGCGHRLAHSLWTQLPKSDRPWSRVTKATGSDAPPAPCPPEVGGLAGCHCAAFPGALVEERRWGTPPAGTVGPLMDRLISRLDGPEPGLAGGGGRGAHCPVGGGGHSGR